MINPKGSTIYLKSQIVKLEEIKQRKISGGFDGWNMGEWTDKEEECLGLLKELVRYRELYYSLEEKIDDDMR